MKTILCMTSENISFDIYIFNKNSHEINANRKKYAFA